MTAGATYYAAIKDFAEAKQNAASDQYALCFTNRAPDFVNDKFLSDIAEIAQGNGYFTGGIVLQRLSAGLSGAAYLAIFADIVFQATADMTAQPFRYIVLVNQTSGGSPLTPAGVKLVGAWDYGSVVTLKQGETFTPDMDQINGLFQMLGA